MAMYSRGMLLSWLGEDLTGYRPGVGERSWSGGIKLLEETGTMDGSCLYIGQGETLRRRAEEGTLPGESVTVLVSAGAGELDGVELPGQVTLMESALGLIPLYNRVHSHIHAFWEWNDALREATFSSGGLQNILEIAGREIHATIAVLNPGFKRLGLVIYPGAEDFATRELEQNGYLSYETIEKIRQCRGLTENAAGGHTEFVLPPTNKRTIIRLIHHHGNLLARLCVTLSGEEAAPAYSDMSEVLAGYVAEYMLRDQSVDYSGNADFGSLVRDIIECRLTDREELAHRVKAVGMNVRYSYHVLVVAFREQDSWTPIPWNYVIAQLREVFPFSDATVYRGEILLLLRKTKRTSRVPFDEEKLRAILEQYNCCIGIGNASDFLSSLPPVYHQTKAGLRIGQVMEPKKRVYFYEDYSVYHIIELAAEATRVNMSSRNLLHLCNNETVALVMYDKKHNTDLLDTLHAYLICGYNATEAAKMLFIHRNTMLYKLRKIETVMGWRWTAPPCGSGCCSAITCWNTPGAI